MILFPWAPSVSPGKLSFPGDPAPTASPFLYSRRFLIKGSVAGGAVYLVYDQELLGPSDKSEAALRKAEEVVPPAMYQFSQYVCQQTGLEMPQVSWLGVGGLQVASGCPWAPSTPAWWSFVFLGLGDKAVTCPHVPASVFLSSQLPTPPKINFPNFRDSWNSGRPLCPCLGDALHPASLPALFPSLFLSTPPCLPVCVLVCHLWN